MRYDILEEKIERKFKKLDAIEIPYGDTYTRAAIIVELNKECESLIKQALWYPEPNLSFYLDLVNKICVGRQKLLFKINDSFEAFDRNLLAELVENMSEKDVDVKFIYNL